MYSLIHSSSAVSSTCTNYNAPTVVTWKSWSPLIVIIVRNLLVTVSTLSSLLPPLFRRPNIISPSFGHNLGPPFNVLAASVRLIDYQSVRIITKTVMLMKFFQRVNWAWPKKKQSVRFAGPQKFVPKFSSLPRGTPRGQVW